MKSPFRRRPSKSRGSTRTPIASPTCRCHLPDTRLYSHPAASFGFGLGRIV